MSNNHLKHIHSHKSSFFLALLRYFYICVFSISSSFLVETGVFGVNVVDVLLLCILKFLFQCWLCDSEDSLNISLHRQMVQSLTLYFSFVTASTAITAMASAVASCYSIYHCMIQRFILCVIQCQMKSDLFVLCVDCSQAVSIARNRVKTAFTLKIRAHSNRFISLAFLLFPFYRAHNKCKWLLQCYLFDVTSGATQAEHKNFPSIKCI